MIQGLVWSAYLDKFVAVLALYHQPASLPAFVFSLSDDLVTWAPVQPLFQPPYDPALLHSSYPTLLDPAAPARGDNNFESIGQTAWLHYTLMPVTNPPWRALMRVPITFEK